MRVTVRIEIDYDESTVSDRDELYRALEREVERHVGNGLLNPSGEEIVDAYRVDIEEGK